MRKNKQKENTNFDDITEYQCKSCKQWFKIKDFDIEKRMCHNCLTFKNRYANIKERAYK